MNQAKYIYIRTYPIVLNIFQDSYHRFQYQIGLTQRVPFIFYQFIISSICRIRPLCYFIFPILFHFRLFFWLIFTQPDGASDCFKTNKLSQGMALRERKKEDLIKEFMAKTANGLVYIWLEWVSVAFTKTSFQGHTEAKVCNQTVAR